MSARTAISSDLRARLTGQPGWTLDRFGNWVLGDRRFKVAARTLKYQHKVGDRWASSRSWFLSRIDWALVEKFKQIAEQAHARAMEKARQFQAEHPDKVVELAVQVQVRENADKDGVEVKFSSKPNDSVLALLRTHGFHWSKRQRLWYARRTQFTLGFAKGLQGPPVESDKTAPAAPVLITSNSDDPHEAGSETVIGLSEPVHLMGTVITA